MCEEGIPRKTLLCFKEADRVSEILADVFSSIFLRRLLFFSRSFA